MQFRDINPLPSPSTFITRGTPLPRWGCARCLLYFEPSSECIQVFGLWNAVKPERIFAKRLIIIRIALPFIHGQRMCVVPAGRHGGAIDPIGGSLSLLHTGLINRPIFPAGNFLSEMPDIGRNSVVLRGDSSLVRLINCCSAVESRLNSICSSRFSFRFQRKRILGMIFLSRNSSYFRMVLDIRIYFFLYKIIRGEIKWNIFWFQIKNLVVKWKLYVNNHRWRYF